MSIYEALKAATRDLVAAAGGCTRAAKVSRVEAAAFSRYGQWGDPRCIPVDVVADLEQDVGEPILTRILADAAGYVLVPKAQVAERAALPQHMADVAGAAGAAIADLAQALADGVVDAREAAALKATFAKAQTELAEAEAVLADVAQGGSAAPETTGASVTSLRRGA